MITYAEPPFERVWAAWNPRRPFNTIFGLQFAGREIEGELHAEAYTIAGAREFLLGDLAEIVLSKDRFEAEVLRRMVR